MTDYTNTANPLMNAVMAAIASRLDHILSLRYLVEWKHDGSPVTDADRYIERLVHDVVAQFCPKATMVSEESYIYGSAISKNGVIVVLDPIDGTENFSSGLKEWGVAFTMWQDSSHLGSFLFMPELNDRLMTGDCITPIRSRIRGFSSSMCPEIQQALGSNGEYRIMGCAVYNLLNVIRGSYARFTNPKGAYIWDLLPGLMLALDHNCEVHVNEEPYDGHFLDPNHRYRIDIQH